MAKSKKAKKGVARPGRTRTRAPKIPKKDLAAAKRFLRVDPIGQRLQAADHALTLLLKGELPRLRDFVLGANFGLREITDIERFEEAFYTDKELTKLVKESRAGGCVKVSLEKSQIQISLFCKKSLTEREAFLFSRSLGEVGALTYATLGLDFSGLAPVDSAVLRE